MKKQVEPVTIYKEDYEGSKFPPHGRYKGYLDGQMIVDEVTGPLNRELFIRFIELAAPLYGQAQLGGAFVTLTLFSQSMLMSQDAVEEFARLAVQFVEAGIAPVAVACVAALDIEGRAVMSYAIREKVFRPAGIAWEIFSERAEALNWLRAQLDGQAR